MIRGQVNTRGMDRKFAGIMKRAGDQRPVFRELKPLVAQDVREHVDARAASDGRWPGYAPTTLRKLRGRRGMVFRRGKQKGQYTKRGARRMANMLGKLRTALKVRFDRRKLEGWSRAPWAGVHQRGGTAGRGSRIPRREFVWASDKLREAYKRALVEHVAGGAK